MQKYNENSNTEFIANSGVDTKRSDVDSFSTQNKRTNNNDFILNEQRSNVPDAEEGSSINNVNENFSLREKEDNSSSVIVNDKCSTKNVEDGGGETSLTNEKPNMQNVEQENSVPTENEEWLDILGSGQLRRKILKRGENTFRPQNSHVCELNLEGRLDDGTIVDKFEHWKIQVGDAELIQGLDLTLPLMDVGEECLVEVAPRFAYGTQGRVPDIPPNSKITYKIELLSSEPEPELEALPVAERKRIGNEKRERGNWWYARQDYTFAIQCYRRALEYLDDVQGGINHMPREDETFSEELHNLFEDRLKVYNNLAAAQMKIKAYDTALQSVENVLHCQPQNVKALFRKGKILAAKGDNASAVSVLRTASQLEPDNKIIKQELLRLVSLRNEDSKNERNLYKKMLGQEKQSAGTNKGPSKSHQLRWGIVFGSVAAVVAGMVAYRYKFL